MARFVRLFLILSVACIAAAPRARGAAVEIPAIRDATLFDLVADTLSASGSGPYVFSGDNSQGNSRRALFRFAVADSIPTGSVITSVELHLSMTQANNVNARTMGLHRVLADWGEGASIAPGGTGSTPQAGDATWQHRFFPDLAWTSPGGDFLAGASATQSVGGTGAYSWSGEGLVADVQHWIDQPTAHHGWVLVGDESANSTVKRFNSRENADMASRPRLVVVFTPPDVPVRSITWGALKRGALAGNGSR